MKGHAMAIGAMVLFLLGAGCATQDVTVSAMVRGDDAKPRVSVELREILTP